MANPCPICADLKFRKAFDELIEAGADLTAAKKYCENELILPEGKVCSAYRIKVHALKHSGVDPDRIHPSFLKVKRPSAETVAANKKQKQVTKAVVETYLDEIAEIDVAKVLGSIGIKEEPKSMSDVLTLVQQMTLRTSMLAGAIAIDSLEKYATDPQGRAYPTVHLKGASLAAEMMSTAFGYSQAVSIQTAVDTVEKSGLQVVDPGNDNRLPESNL